MDVYSKREIRQTEDGWIFMVEVDGKTITVPLSKIAGEVIVATTRRLMKDLEDIRDREMDN